MEKKSGFKHRLRDFYVPQVKVPEGWRLSKPASFAVTLAPGKPSGVTSWKDTQGRPVVYKHGAWQLVKEAKAKAKSPLDNEWSVVSRLRRKITQNAVRIRENLEKKGMHEEFGEFSDEELGSLGAYTGVFYDDFNGILRGRSTLQGEEKQLVTKAVETMHKALEKMEPASPTTFYRGLAGDAEKSRTVSYIRSLKPGDIYEDKGFGSFTVDLEQAAEFVYSKTKEKVLIKAVNPRTFRALHHFSISPGEKEFVSMPRTKFRVVSNSYKSAESLGFNHPISGDVRVLELEEIH